MDVFNASTARAYVDSWEATAKHSDSHARRFARARDEQLALAAAVGDGREKGFRESAAVLDRATTKHLRLASEQAAEHARQAAADEKAAREYAAEMIIKHPRAEF